MKSFALIVLGFLLSLCPTRAAATESVTDSLSSPADTPSLHYFGETLITMGSGGHSPFWLGAGRDGMTAVDGHGLVFRAGISRPTAVAYPDFRRSG